MNGICGYSNYGNLECLCQFHLPRHREDHSGLESALEPSMHINRYPYSQTSTKLEREKAASFEAA